MSNPNDALTSLNFIPESEPGKGDGQGWRLKKDGTVEICGAFVKGTRFSYRCEAGEQGQVQITPETCTAEVKPTYKCPGNMDWSILDLEWVADLGVLQTKGFDGVKPGFRMGTLEVSEPTARAREASEIAHIMGTTGAILKEAETRAKADRAAVSMRIEMPGGTVTLGNLAGSMLEEFSNDTAALVANATQSLEQLISHHNRMIIEMEKIEGGSIDLLIMASQQFRMGEALLRELLRKVDTQDVDDGHKPR